MKAIGWMFLGGGWLGMAGGGAAAGAGQTRVRWFGQSFFQLTSSSGLRVVIDPFDNTFFIGRSDLPAQREIWVPEIQ